MPIFGGSGSVMVAAAVGFLAAAVFGFAEARGLAVAGIVLAVRGAVMSGGSMTANHVEHGIATFPGITIKTVPLHFGRGTKSNVPGWG
jgi:hypothetical protein